MDATTGRGGAHLVDNSDYGGVVRVQGHIKSARCPPMSHAPRHSAPGSKCAAILTTRAQIQPVCWALILS